MNWRKNILNQIDGIFLCFFFLYFHISYIFFLFAWYNIHISNISAYFSLSLYSLHWNEEEKTGTHTSNVNWNSSYLLCCTNSTLYTVHTHLVFLIDEKFLHTRLIYVEFTAITASFNNNLSAFVSFKLTEDEFRVVSCESNIFKFPKIKEKHIFELFFRICRFNS